METNSKNKRPLVVLSIIVGNIIGTSCEDQQIEPEVPVTPDSLQTTGSQAVGDTTESPLDRMVPATARELMEATEAAPMEFTDKGLASTGGEATYSAEILPSHLVYEETVEGPQPFSTAHDWDVGDWDYALRFVEYPRFRGVRSARFEIREDQPLVASGKRSEVTVIKTAEEGMEKEMWYSFSVMFPPNGYEYDVARDCINQWFQNGSPATSLRTHRDRILLESGYSTDSRKRYDLGPIVKGKWYQFVIHFIHSHEGDGLIELWLDGVKRLTLQGGNMYDDDLPKWKIGIYKAAFQDGTSDVTRRIIFFDNVRVGNKYATYETMRPAL